MPLSELPLLLLLALPEETEAEAAELLLGSPLVTPWLDAEPPPPPPDAELLLPAPPRLLEALWWLRDVDLELLARTEVMAPVLTEVDGA